jgi:hypothetical protein
VVAAWWGRRLGPNVNATASSKTDSVHFGRSDSSAGTVAVPPPATIGGVPVKGGLLVGAKQQSIDAYVGKDTTAGATKDLAAVGITPVAKKLHLDLGALVTTLDPSGGFFGPDKVEGVATTDGGRTAVLGNDNDNDFGLDGVTTAAPPYALHPKTLPDGRQDDGEYLVVDTTRLPAVTSTATVTIDVR